MSFCEASDGCRLHFGVQGEGYPVVLISGLGGLSAFWNEIAPILAGRFRVISFDQRGTGRSDRPDGGYTIERIARDTGELLDELEIGNAFVVGHSTGGVIAQQLALMAPERITGLVLSATWSRPDQRFRAFFETRRTVLERAGPEIHSRLSCLLGYSPAWLEANGPIVEQIVRQAREEYAPLSVAQARIQMLIDFDGVDGLDSIRVPTLVCGAVDDMIIPFSHSQQVARAVSKARLLRYEGGHFFPRVTPTEFGKDVLGFLGKLS